MSSIRSTVDWSKLCHDMLGSIVDKLSDMEDIVRFGAVCRPWRSVSVEKLHLAVAYPWLMLAEKEDESDTSRGFYSLSTNKVYNLNLPEAHGRRCWSSCGWLITFGLDLEIHILNPFSRVQIRLPPQTTLPHQDPDSTLEEIRREFISKIILTSAPSLSVKDDDDDDGGDGDECVAMAICSQFGKLAFSRLGDEVWTAVDSYWGIQDVIYFNGQFYAVELSGKLLICDISNSDPKTVEFAEPPEGFEYIDQNNYLVESLGELFMVARDCVEVGRDDLDNRTTGIVVYKFNFDDRKWTEVKSLDNRAMFVGNNTSFAIFPSDPPGCEPDCIYFTDDNLLNLHRGNSGLDLGVFSMEEQESYDLYEGPDMLSNFCTPLWFTDFATPFLF